jgi:hypothetical protein
MDEFINPINRQTFESTNGLWNELMLNDPWSVGYVTTLIEMRPFKQKEEWEAFYYETGEMRLSKVSLLPRERQETLNNEQLVRRNRDFIYQLDSSVRNLNYSHGRTKQEIRHKGHILYKAAQAKGLGITEQDCVEAVRFRTICQTWNGVVIRERNTVRTLNKKFPQVIFESTSGEFDHRYAVDYELKLQETLICGIQIKPKSYLGKALHLKKAQAANARKNQAYLNEFGKPVFNVISKGNGEVINTDVIGKISELLDDV